MEKEKCKVCNGDGYYADHAPMNTHNPETGECMICPIQVQCEECEATGFTPPNPKS